MLTYLVGGAVRDTLLGIPFSERDWVVTGATEQEMLDLGFRRADARFPVFLHPETDEEHALARRETKTGPGYKGFDIETSPEVTLEQDLSRRDLTINAIAQDAAGRLVDPFDGRADLDARLLRHVTPAFDEDPVRLLRLARFAAKLGHLGFRIAEDTWPLLSAMAADQDLMHLQAERLWQEMHRALNEPQPWRFFEVLQLCGAAPRLLPELDLSGLAAESGDERQTPASYPSALAALRRCVQAGADVETRFAVVMADAARGHPDAPESLCLRLRAERGHCQVLTRLVAGRDRLDQLDLSDAEALLDFLQAFGGLKTQGEFDRLTLALSALNPDFDRAIQVLQQARRCAASVSVADVARPGLAGAELGAALRRVRVARIESGSDSDPAA